MKGKLADFRSDTVTRPTDAMYRAMVAAPLGDDVFGDDPTVRALEERCAELLGKEQALFVPSGTMANSIAIAISTRPGDEIILLEDAHTYLYEVGGSSRLWGVHPHPLPGAGGCLDPEQVEDAVRSDDVHHPRTSLVLLENTHNMQGGRVVPPARLAAVREVCRRHGLHLHLDGARLFNAVAATGLPVTDFTAEVDTVCCCFSKALACPVGSILAGEGEAIGEARRIRKLLGGGLRQAGVLAACALVALEEEVPRLEEDHRRARLLADRLRAIEGVVVSPDPPETNILMVEIPGRDPGRHGRLTEYLAARGVLTLPFENRRIRLVTHRDIDDGDVGLAATHIASFLASPG